MNKNLFYRQLTVRGFVAWFPHLLEMETMCSTLSDCQHRLCSSKYF